MFTSLNIKPYQTVSHSHVSGFSQQAVVLLLGILRHIRYCTYDFNDYIREDVYHVLMLIERQLSLLSYYQTLNEGLNSSFVVWKTSVVTTTSRYYRDKIVCVYVHVHLGLTLHQVQHNNKPANWICHCQYCS